MKLCPFESVKIMSLWTCTILVIKYWSPCIVYLTWRFTIMFISPVDWGGWVPPRPDIPCPGGAASLTVRPCPGRPPPTAHPAAQMYSYTRPQWRALDCPPSTDHHLSTQRSVNLKNIVLNYQHILQIIEGGGNNIGYSFFPFSLFWSNMKETWGLQYPLPFLITIKNTKIYPISLKRMSIIFDIWFLYQYTLLIIIPYFLKGGGREKKKLCIPIKKNNFWNPNTTAV